MGPMPVNKEPYRGLEAIGNRREYIREQMEGGTPVFASVRAIGLRESLVRVTWRRQPGQSFHTRFGVNHLIACFPDNFGRRPRPFSNNACG